MKEKLNIDKFFTTRLDGHQEDVSPGLWNEIEKDFLNSYLERESFFKRVWPLVAIFTAGMISLGIVLNRDMNSTTYNTSVAENTTEAILTPGTEAETSITSGNSDLQNQQADITVNEEINETEDITSETTAPVQLVPENIEVSEDQITPINNTTDDAEYASTETEEVTIEQTDYISPYLLFVGDFHYFESFTSEVGKIDNIEAVKLQSITNYNDYYRKADLLLGAHITPALTYYPEGENKNSYAFELTADYQKSDFFVQSGIGAEYYSEKGNYSINYESFDSVDYYYDVTSFNIDPNNPDSIIFNLKSTNVYDSVNHLKIEETSNKYLYMQIPLNVGYEIWGNSRFSVKIRGGVIFSWLVYKDEPVVTYHANDVTIVDISNNYPGRRKYNWQWMAGIGLNVRLSKKLIFSVEPVYKQYINSIYTKGSGMDKKLPYSVGLRTGIYLNF